jgi:hypothetical protein
MTLAWFIVFALNLLITATVYKVLPGSIRWEFAIPIVVVPLIMAVLSIVTPSRLRASGRVGLGWVSIGGSFLLWLLALSATFYLFSSR